MACIYRITNILNGAVYIGSSIRTNPRKRWWRHTKDLRDNIHHSRHLQRAWNKYGESNFEFEIIENNIDDSKILHVEQSYLDNRKKNFPNRLNYNECWTAGNCKGRKFSKETIEKLKQSHLGIHPTLETRQKQMLVWENKCKTPYSFTDPTGIVYDNVRNLRKFARQHNLDACQLGKLYIGKSSEYKGWIKTGNLRKRYKIVDDGGKVYYDVLRLKPFCVEHKLNYKMIHKICLKQKRSLNGWTVEKVEL